MHNLHDMLHHQDEIQKEDIPLVHFVQQWKVQKRGRSPGVRYCDVDIAIPPVIVVDTSRTSRPVFCMSCVLSKPKKKPSPRCLVQHGEQDQYQETPVVLRFSRRGCTPNCCRHSSTRPNRSLLEQISPSRHQHRFSDNLPRRSLRIIIIQAVEAVPITKLPFSLKLLRSFYVSLNKLLYILSPENLSFIQVLN